MPFIVFFWLLIPWALDVWLTFMLADALDLDAWLFFVLPAVAGVVLLTLEWRRVQEHWQALRRLEVSPLAILGSLRRSLAGFLLVLPGIGSACIALLLLFFGRSAPTPSTPFSRPHTSPPYQEPPRERATNSRSSVEIIEGEYRREE
jgi:Protein affecting phage T7 exclusion by the F plasmid